MVLTFEPDGLPQQAIEEIELTGSELTVKGVSDQFAAWSATVTLTDDQRRQLHEATA